MNPYKETHREGRVKVGSRLPVFLDFCSFFLLTLDIIVTLSTGVSSHIILLSKRKTGPRGQVAFHCGLYLLGDNRCPGIYDHDCSA